MSTTKKTISPEMQKLMANPDVQDAFKDFEEHRRKLRKPMTDRAKELNLEELTELSGGDVAKAVKIIERSVKKGWQGLFPLK